MWIQQGVYLMEDSAVKSILSIIVVNLVIYPISFVTNILVTNYLGVHDKGIVSYILVINGFVVPLLMFGFESGTRYYISTQQYDVSKTFFSSVFYGIILSIFSSVAISFLWYQHWLGEIGNLLTLNQLYLVLISVPFVILNVLLTRVLIGTSKFILNNRISLYYVVINIFCMLFFIYVADNGINGILMGTAVSHALNFAILFYHNIRLFKPTFTFNTNFFNDSYKYGLKVWINHLIRNSNNRIDQFIIGYFINAKGLGLFSVSVGLAELTQKIPQVMMQVVYNKIAVSDDGEKTNILLLSHKVSFYMILLISLAEVLLGYWAIILLYGEEFSYSYYLLLAYIPGVIAYMSTRIFLNYNTASGKAHLNTYIHLAGFAIGLPFFLLLINYYGILGASFGSSIVYFISNLAAVYIFNRKEKVTLAQLYLFDKKELTLLRIKYVEAMQIINRKLKIKK